MLLRRAAMMRSRMYPPAVAAGLCLRRSHELSNSRALVSKPTSLRASGNRSVAGATGRACRRDEAAVKSDAVDDHAAVDTNIELACTSGPRKSKTPTLKTCIRHTRAAQERTNERCVEANAGSAFLRGRNSSAASVEQPPTERSYDFGGDNRPNPNPTTDAYDQSWDSAFTVAGSSHGVDSAMGEREDTDVGAAATAFSDGLGREIQRDAATIGSGQTAQNDGTAVREDAGKGGRVGEERAHKMWVTMTGGKAVSEQEWEAQGGAGGATEDTSVIQFHAGQETAESAFQGYGVIKEDKAEDIKTLVDSYTAPALATALRDRETALQVCASLLVKGDMMALRRALNPFTAQQVAISRRDHRRLDLDPEGFTKVHMYTLKKVLQRLPRHVTTLTAQRASVMIPLCNVDGVASVLFTKRSSTLRSHKNEVCFPGGKVDIGVDQHIIHTALREMGEEIGISESAVDVLGVLRCDWGEVASLIGVAVTPVVGFLGNLSREQINPNPDEVSHCFTIPIRYLLTQERWKIEKYKAPAFVGGPYVIWGLTGYILHRFVNDVLLKHLVIV